MYKKILGLFILMILFTSTAFAADYSLTMKVGETLVKACTDFGLNYSNGASSTNETVCECVGDYYDGEFTFKANSPGTCVVTLDGNGPTKTVDVTVQPQFLFAKGANVVLYPAALAYIADNAAKKFGADNYISNAFSYNTSIIAKNTTYSNTDKAYFDVKEVKGSTTLLLTEVNDPQTYSGLNHNYYVSVEDINPQITMELGDTLFDLADACNNQKDNFGNEFVIDEELEASGYVPDDFMESYELIKEGIFTLILVQDDPKTSSNRIPYFFTVRVGNPTPITDIYVNKFYKSYLGLTYDPIQYYIYSVNQGADPKAVTIESDNNKVAKITEDGMIKATGIGECTITITSNDDPTISESFTWYTRPYYAAGNGEKFVAAPMIDIKYDDKGDEIDEFNNIISNSNPSVLDAEITDDNEITFTGKGEGYATIKIDQYNQPGVYRYITVNCVNSLVPVYKNQEVKIPTSLIYSTIGLWGGQLDEGSITQAWVQDENGEWTELTFNNDEIKFTPTEAGCYWLWVADKDNYSCYYYLYADDKIPVTGVELIGPSSSLKIGDKYQLICNVFPENATDKTVKYISLHPSLISVDQNGVVTALANGKAVVWVKTNDGGYIASCSISIGTPVKSVKLDKSKIYLNTGDKYQLNATINPENASDKSVKWVSSDSSIAYVSQTGEVYATGRGTATITVITRDGNKKAYCKVYVNQPVKSVKLNKSKAELFLGKQDTLVATVLPEDANNKGVVWSSSDSSIVSVSQNGRIKGKGLGTATITVTTKDGGYTAKCKVTVVQPVTGVVIVKEKISIKKGAKQKVAAVVLPSNAKYKSVIWSSSIPKNVSVDKNGVVKGLKSNSSAYIKVTTVDGGYTDKVLVYVR